MDSTVCTKLPTFRGTGRVQQAVAGEVVSMVVLQVRTSVVVDVVVLGDRLSALVSSDLQKGTGSFLRQKASKVFANANPATVAVSAIPTPVPTPVPTAEPPPLTSLPPTMQPETPSPAPATPQPTDPFDWTPLLPGSFLSPWVVLSVLPLCVLLM